MSDISDSWKEFEAEWDKETHGDNITDMQKAINRIRETHGLRIGMKGTFVLMAKETVNDLLEQIKRLTEENADLRLCLDELRNESESMT